MQISDTSPKLWLQYSSNNDFFPESIEFLQKIWFVNILCIDMYVKYSFQKMSRATLVQGAEIDTYDNDHMINDTFFVHKITIPRETSITRALVYIKLNQKQKAIDCLESFQRQGMRSPAVSDLLDKLRGNKPVF